MPLITFTAKSGASNSSVMMDVYIQTKQSTLCMRKPEILIVGSISEYCIFNIFDFKVFLTKSL